MGSLSQIRTKNALQAFKKAGFTTVSQKGSHIKMRRILSDGKIQTIIIPNHPTLKEGTLKNGILKPISMSPDEFIQLLKK